MAFLFNKPFKHSLIFNILLVVGAVVLVNSLIFSFDWSTNSSDAITQSPSYAPPGWVVGMVWTVWFIGLAVSRWIVGKLSKSNFISERVLLDVLIISCLAYPFYSLAIGSVIGGLIGNIFTVFLSSYVFYRIRKKSKIAAWLIFPIIPWVIFATIITLAETGMI